MDAKEDISKLIQAILLHKTNNYLYEYLTQREEQASFTEDCQTEHNSYSSTLRSYKNHPLLNATAKIAARFLPSKSICGCACDDLRFGKTLDVRLHFILARASAVALVTICGSDEAESASSQSRLPYDDPLGSVELDLHSITYNSCHLLLIDEKRQQKEEEEAAVRAASLGHLNIFGQTVGSSTEVGTSIGEPFLDCILTPFAMTSSPHMGEQENQEEVENDNGIDKNENPEESEDNATTPTRKRKLGNSSEYGQNLKIRLHGHQSSESEPEGDENDDNGEEETINKAIEEINQLENQVAAPPMETNDEECEQFDIDLEKIAGQLKMEPLSEWKVGTVNVTQRFRQYQKRAVDKTLNTGLTWNDTYEIL
ncbi:hypothetical protein BC937DRAFT_95019 [Endogone sp. FLAS-F59071]|nr:hypothetical protein BC937DRAFT_95019 [Endogone sp. FLAS-F59071]|eukprot:RUS22916.1 hypothetical protein BC937DRAFT_95019 [Endogone sp. FLAS-F59071]